MNQSENQSVVIEAMSEIAIEDLSVQNAAAIKGGQSAGNDVYQWDPGDGVDSVHRRDLAVRV